MKIKIDELKNKISKKLEGLSLPFEYQEAIVQHILYAELCGKQTHGIRRIPLINKCCKSLILSKPTSLHLGNNILSIDGNGQYALYVCDYAVDELINSMSLKNNELMICSIKNYCGNTGVMGYYASKLVKKGYISIIMCNSEIAIAPFGGKDAVLGTNPICFGFPTNKASDIIVDFATSTKTYGELMNMADLSQKVSFGSVLDENGRPSNNPSDADNCQLPMSGVKGYGLALAIEILSGLFIGATSSYDGEYGTAGMFMVCFKKDIFVSDNVYFEKLNALIEKIKSTSLAESYNYESNTIITSGDFNISNFDSGHIEFSEILLPGEKSQKKYNQSLKNGFVEINDKLYKKYIENNDME